MTKQAKASELLIKLGLSTHAREARILTGTKYSKNMTRLKRENELKVKAMEPLAEFDKKYSVQGGNASNPLNASLQNSPVNLLSLVDEIHDATTSN